MGVVKQQECKNCGTPLNTLICDRCGVWYTAEALNIGVGHTHLFDRLAAFRYAFVCRCGLEVEPRQVWRWERW